jgi:hypothetical protein
LGRKNHVSVSPWGQHNCLKDNNFYSQSGVAADGGIDTADWFTLSRAADMIRQDHKDERTLIQTGGLIMAYIADKVARPLGVAEELVRRHLDGLIRRRDLIALVGAAAWPLTAAAQPRTIPVLGSLNLGSPTFTTRSSGAGGVEGGYMAAFRHGLVEAGFVEGQSIVIENRWAYNQGQRLAPLAAELAQRQVAVIVAIDSGPTVLAAKAATSTIPIVFATPIQSSWAWLPAWAGLAAT